MWGFQKASPISKATDFPQVVMAPSSAAGSRSRDYFQAKAGLLRLHRTSKQPADTPSAPPSCCAMDTPKAGNGLTWRQISTMFLPFILTKFRSKKTKKAPHVAQMLL